jgi:hypothetical protein
MGDQLIARPLLTAPSECDDDDDEVGMNGFGKGNRSTRRKPAPTPLYPPQIPLADPGANPGRRGGKPGTNRFSYGKANGSELLGYNSNKLLRRAMLSVHLSIFLATSAQSEE